MRTKLGWGYLMAVLICGPALAQSARAPEAMLGAALHQERVTGDLQAAIDGYQKVLATGGVPSSVAAQAQYHIGLCYEKLGNQEARSAFEAVIRDYADEAEIVRQAQTRLAAMRADAPDAPVFRRVWSGQGVDTEGTVSSDGRYLSFPDWPTGNLALRDLVTGTNRNSRRGRRRGRGIAPRSPRASASPWWKRTFSVLRVGAIVRQKYRSPKRTRRDIRVGT